MLELLASPKKLQAAEPGERSDPCQPQAANLDRRPRRRGGIGARGTAKTSICRERCMTTLNVSAPARITTAAIPSCRMLRMILMNRRMR